MNPKIGWAATIVVIIIASIVLFFPQVLQDGGQTGLFTLRFSCIVNGNCTASETYADCPEDCCDTDCTGDGPELICHASCDGFGGCSDFVTGCDGLTSGTYLCLNSKQWTQCCSGDTMDCAADEYCIAGSCGGCSTVCDASCESAGCFGIDPDCDELGNPTGECCGNGTCDSSEDCVTCPAECPGSVVCSSDAGCDDSNSLTVDTCNSPGECDSSCSNVPCSVACSNDAGCDDSNSLTIDSCSNPGTCDASCSNTACDIACSADSDCDDGDSLTVDTCTSPGTCSAACSNTSCSVVCSSDSDCDDSDSSTVDVCVDPGTCNANCSNTTCNIECFSSSDCDDGDSSTVDTCNNAGTCDADCSSVVCTPTCFSNADCDDANPETVDTCIHPGGCGAHCLNDYCTPACYSNADCDDSNPLTTDACANPGTCDASCSNTVCTVVCSSNADCDDSNPLTSDECNNPGVCASRCSHSEAEYQLSFEFPSGVESDFARGELIDLNVVVKDSGGRVVEGALISLSDSEGNEVELQDVGSGRYAGQYSIPLDFPVGEHIFSFFALKVDSSGSEIVGYEELVRDVNTGRIIAVLVEPPAPEAMAGEKLELKFRLVYGSGQPVLDADVNAALNNVSIPLSGEGNGVFAGHYLFSDADLKGAFLVVSAEDGFGNMGSTVIEFSVQQPLQLFHILAIAALIVAAALAFVGLRRTHRLSSLLRRMGRISLSKRRLLLQMSIAKEKKQRELLSKKIAGQEKELAKIRREIVVERRKQALAMKRLPRESGYAVHKGAIVAAVKIKRLFSRQPKKSKEQLEVENRLQEIDEEIRQLREKIRNLEAEYCKQTIKEDFFRQKLFGYREKVHLLELEKKKIE